MTEDLRLLWTLKPLIQRDAYERFLYMKAFMKRASWTWSGFLGFTLLGALLFAIISYVGLIKTSQSNVYRIMKIVGKLDPHDSLASFSSPSMNSGQLFQEFLVMGIPIYCLAFANARVGAIKSFGRTCPSDFSFLGLELLNWMRDSNIFWTIWGVPVTPTVLQTYAYSFVTILPALIWALTHYSFIS
jgi:hypothetical protein